MSLMLPSPCGTYALSIRNVQVSTYLQAQWTSNISIEIDTLHQLFHYAATYPEFSVLKAAYEYRRCINAVGVRK